MAEVIKRLLDPRKIERYLKGVTDVEAPWSVAGLLSQDMWIFSGPDGITLSATRCDHVLIEPGTHRPERRSAWPLNAAKPQTLGRSEEATRVVADGL
ncbi:hypothetical protein [Microbispora sp. GKU 823]|uniref:hypothetical protein n=1 Tax=Microbispora sp. GKU 823 TaxID=1652100 RepID=UPI00117FAB07|nr:hypothetical protein [Microbispora sp. GKU 823]